MQVTEQPRRGRPQAWNRDAILLAARTVAIRRGYDGLRFSDVAQTTGVPVSSLQYAFGTRDELVREVLRAGVEWELGQVEKSMRGVADPWARLQVFIRRGISTDNVVRRDAWLMWIEYWRASLRDEIVREHYGQVWSTWRAMVRDTIEAGVVAGQFSMSITSDEATQVVIAIVDGLGLQLEVGDTGTQAGDAIQTATTAVASLLGHSHQRPGAR